MALKEFDIAIVGGGTSGLYAAWRLRQAWCCSKVSREALAEKLGRSSVGELEVVVIEQDPTCIGGRLRSAELPFPGGSVIAEVGAMRFTTRHRLLRKLLSELDIRTVPFEGSGFSTRYYLRGKHFGESDIKCGDKENFPYHLQGSEQQKSPTELLSQVLEATLRELSLDDDATPETLRVLEKLRGEHSRGELKHWEWEEIRRHGLLTGRVHLRNIGMWNLIHHYLGADAAHFVEDGFGYESIIGNWNISDAIPWFIADFTPAQTYETVVGGFSEVVKRLSWKITNHPEDSEKHRKSRTNDKNYLEFRCTVVMNTRVTGLSRPKDGAAESKPITFELSTEKTDSNYKHENQEWGEHPILAKAVILALPKWPLERLNLDDLLLDPSGKEPDKPLRGRDWKAQLLMVRDHRLVKIVQGYRHAWWRKPESPRGAGSRIFTDLPLRQLYYFDREWLEERGRYQYYDENGKITDRNGKADGGKPEIEGIVVAYLDGHHASFWRFIPAVMAELKRVHGSIPQSTALPESEKREAFGQRIWGWPEPDEELKGLRAQNVEQWSDEKRALYLYFNRLGLFDRASTKMSHVLRQLHSSPTHPRDQAQESNPVAGAYAFWENFGERFEAGWHTWEPGVDSTLAMKCMVQPFPVITPKNAHSAPKNRYNVYVCGEAYSSEQGWIEGGLKSVEMVMDRLGVMLPGEEYHPGISKPEISKEERKTSESIRDYVGLGPKPKTARKPNSETPSKDPSIPLSAAESLMLIFGETGIDPDSYRPEPSFRDQADRALDRLCGRLEKGGGGKFELVRVYLESMAHSHEFKELYYEKLGGNGHTNVPTPIIVAVKALPHDALIAVDAIARVRNGTNGSGSAR
jgi:hypothetical protein